MEMKGLDGRLRACFCNSCWRRPAPYGSPRGMVMGECKSCIKPTNPSLASVFFYVKIIFRYIRFDAHHDQWSELS
jgi:hypothetical protein